MAAQNVSSCFDALVIGAGIQGSFTAYHLAKNNMRTLLLEQFLLPHSRGSSHGQTRIIRKTYDKNFYTQMMIECYQLWKQLETEANVTLYRQTGLIVMAVEGNLDFQARVRTLVQNQVPMESLTSEDFSKRFPAVNLPLGSSAIIDKTAGVLYADRALKTVQDLFQRFGGMIRDGEKVVDIQPGSLVSVTTTAGMYRAKNLVITAGPWANKLLNPMRLQLPLKTLRIAVPYWKEKVPGTYGISKSFPCFLVLNQARHHIYGLPSNEYPGLMKICYHHGIEAEPDERDVTSQTHFHDIKVLADFVSEYLPGLDPTPAIVESCMYTLTPDEDFILDRHPVHSNIIIGAGFSGHGFKLAPVVGKVLCELSMGKRTSYSLSPFKISRFQLKSVL
ncbi:peroxisomal sarcosine oxidase [Callorhinchus milii]|uniref:Peroxisomal sarcosine oxidase n=1 Tax=Callorhinchus milii TaxID=7868 RepID=A0A4W3ITQ0_CALMI|nr:peroxisomal sarcosine oxidase [Callorhinchus milii]|eukprot:gi/632965617/ref/XP_007898980.1/ PREDICTED: peroxisomal sarcosine oxidase isoform X1 [Callorhinchus milii]